MEPSSMSSSAISIVTKQMESMSITNRVLRRSKTLPLSRYSPYNLGSNFSSKNEKQKEKAIRLGFELSICVAEATFLLSGDIRSAVSFGCWLCKNVGNEDYEGPVVERLSRVFLHVFETYILPKIGPNCHAGENSIQWEVITISTQHFAFAVQALDRIVSILNNGGVVKSSGLEYYNQELKNLEENLRSAKHVSEVNGFAMEVIKAKVLQLWIPLFQAKPQGLNPKNSFKPLEKYTTMTSCALGNFHGLESPQRLPLEPSSMTSIDIAKRIEKLSIMQRVLPVKERLPYSRYTTRTNFTKEKQKEEAVKLGVELSLFVAETVFLLSDDIRSILHFCFWLFKIPGMLNFNGPVFGRLFHVIEYVFPTHIKPKNGVYQTQDVGKSIHWQQFKTSSQHFASGVRVLDRIVTILKNGGLVKSAGFGYCSHELKKLEEKLRSFRHVSEANEFVRESIKCNISHLWKSLFETTPQVLNPNTRVLELFGPVVNEVNQLVCCHRLASLLI